VAAYAPPRLTDDDATAARADAIEVRRLAFNARPRLQRWLYLIDPRRLRG
jgi:hypothetical protein